jgi:hypothetical protein
MAMTINLTHLKEDDGFRRAYDVMLELRPHLSDVSAFVDQVQRQQIRGYELLAAVEGQTIVGLAGYRMQENLLYVSSYISMT